MKNHRSRYSGHRFLPKGIVKLKQTFTIFQARATGPGPQINKLAVVLSGETVNKFLKLTIPARVQYLVFHRTWSDPRIGQSSSFDAWLRPHSEEQGHHGEQVTSREFGLLFQCGLFLRRGLPERIPIKP
jgi:hypothetical protein